MQQERTRQAGPSGATRKRLGPALTRPLGDLLSARHHSGDFTGTRARLIRERIAPLALVLAIGLPLWIPLEYYLVEPAQFVLLAILRLVDDALYDAKRQGRNRVTVLD